MGDGEGFFSDLLAFFAVSSADPGLLLDYATLGVVLDEDLSIKSSAVTAALDALATAGDPHELVPSMGDVAIQLGDLAGDWAALDDFVGRVGVGFARHRSDLVR